MSSNTFKLTANARRSEYKDNDNEGRSSTTNRSRPDSPHPDVPGDYTRARSQVPAAQAAREHWARSEVAFSSSTGVGKESSSTYVPDSPVSNMVNEAQNEGREIQEHQDSNIVSSVEGSETSFSTFIRPATNGQYSGSDFVRSDVQNEGESLTSGLGSSAARNENVGRQEQEQVHDAEIRLFEDPLDSESTFTMPSTIPGRGFVTLPSTERNEQERWARRRLAPQAVPRDGLSVVEAQVEQLREESRIVFDGIRSETEQQIQELAARRGIDINGLPNVQTLFRDWIMETNVQELQLLPIPDTHTHGNDSILLPLISSTSFTIGGVARILENRIMMRATMRAIWALMYRITRMIVEEREALLHHILGGAPNQRSIESQPRNIPFTDSMGNPDHARHIEFIESMVVGLIVWVYDNSLTLTDGVINYLVQETTRQHITSSADTTDAIIYSASETSEVNSSPQREMSETEECTICYTQISRESRIVIKPCGHVFDKDCIMRWFESKYEATRDVYDLTCPLCRERTLYLQHKFNEARTRNKRIDLERHFRNWTPPQRRRSVSSSNTVSDAGDLAGSVDGDVAVAREDQDSDRGQSRDASPEPDGLVAGTQRDDYVDDDVTPDEIEALFDSMRFDASRGAPERRVFDRAHWENNTAWFAEIFMNGHRALVRTEAQEQVAREVEDIAMAQANRALRRWDSGEGMSARELIWGTQMRPVDFELGRDETPARREYLEDLLEWYESYEGVRYEDN